MTKNYLNFVDINGNKYCIEVNKLYSVVLYNGVVSIIYFDDKGFADFIQVTVPKSEFGKIETFENAVYF